MRIKNLVEEMGGVARFTSEPLAPTLRETMSEFLDITREEFADYLDYLELYGAETGFIKEYKLTPYSNLPEYCYPDDAIPPVGGNIAWGGGGLGFFIAPVKGGGQLSPMSERLKIYKNRIPDNFLPISSNEFGDLICLCTQGERTGQIFYWDHENEWDEEDYIDDFGVPMPEEVKLQNIYLIGKNLYDCFIRMTPDLMD